MNNDEAWWLYWLRKFNWKNYDTNRWSNKAMSASIKPGDTITFYRGGKVLCKYSLTSDTTKGVIGSLVSNVKYCI